jgi:hypothetical protein
MATLQNRIEEIISTYKNKTSRALYGTESMEENSIFIGLRALPQGFYVCTTDSSKIRKYLRAKITNDEYFGCPNSRLEATLNRCLSKLRIDCLYDDNTYTSYTALPSEIKMIKGAFVPMDIIKKDPFLKKLFEREESNAEYSVNSIKHNSDVGLDDAEKFETFSLVLDEKEAHQEGRELDEEVDDIEEEFE